jgi:SAM-dependent methyltransferase
MTTPPDDAIIAQSGYTHPGFAERYERYRPQPPAALVGLLTQYAGGDRPRLVVDLGSGTGLSSFLWAEHARAVVGVEPNPAMRQVAETRLAARGMTAVRFLGAYAQDTGLPTGAADIVTCSQAFHWMEPERTLAEVTRLLRPGGVFAAYDYAWPPALHWEVEQAWATCQARVQQLGEPGAPDTRWAKTGHLDRLRVSKHFRFVREVLLHAQEEGDAERFCGLTITSGVFERWLAAGKSEADLGLDTLRAVATRALGDRAWPWYLGYHVRLGVR